MADDEKSIQNIGFGNNKQPLFILLVSLSTASHK